MTKLAKNRNYLKDLKIGKAATNDTLERIVTNLIKDLGPIPKLMGIIDGKSNILEQNRFIPLVARAYENNKYNYMGRLLKLANANSMWIEMKDTELGQELAKAWTSILKPTYDPLDIDCNRIPFMIPCGSESEEAEYEEIYKFLNELLNTRWAVMEGQFIIAQTKIIIMHVADIPMGVD